MVIASIFQNHPTIGYSNIIGSSISNILGAFSLGLLFAGPGPIVFDRSAKIYSGALFLITSVYVLTSLTGHLNLTGGIFFMVAFGVYLFSVGSAIYDGILRAPKGEANGDAGSHNNVANGRDEEILQQNGNSSLSTNPPYTVTIYPTVTHCPPNETSPLLQNGTLPTEHHAPPQHHHYHHISIAPSHQTPSLPFPRSPPRFPCPQHIRLHPVTHINQTCLPPLPLQYHRRSNNPFSVHHTPREIPRYFVRLTSSRWNSRCYYSWM